ASRPASLSPARRQNPVAHVVPQQGVSQIKTQESISGRTTSGGGVHGGFLFALSVACSHAVSEKKRDRGALVGRARVGAGGCDQQAKGTRQRSQPASRIPTSGRRGLRRPGLR